MKDRSYQTGMTLIELMIAMLMGVFLLAGVLQIFISSRHTNRMQEGLSRLQENGRFALDFLAKDIRMAGFLGCSSGAALTNTLNLPANYLNDFATAIQGFEATSDVAWAPDINLATTPLGNAAITSPLGGSDVITIRRAEDRSFTVTAHAAATSPLTLDASATNANLISTGFLTSAAANDFTVAVVSNCSSAAVFQVSGIAGTVLSHDVGANAAPCVPCNAADDLGGTYVGGQVYPINTISYYVRTNPSAQPALYRRVGINDAEELVEGIELMTILYGEDTDADGTANYYVAANAVVNMARVVSIRITLTARTIDGNLTATGDGRIRRSFTSTMAVRNRLP